MIMTMQKPHSTDCNLLRFVSKLQEKSIIQKIKIQLQEYPDIQYSMILFCCWHAEMGQGRLTRQELQQLQTAVFDWHLRITQKLINLITPLNEMRLSKLKEMVASYIEISEQDELSLLNDVLVKFTKLNRSPQQKLTEACKNIMLYCKLQNIAITANLCELFYQLLACVFPTIDLLETHAICQKIFNEESDITAKQEKLFLD